MNSKFLWIALVIIILAAGGIFISWSFSEKTLDCEPPYLTSCRTNLDCLL